MSAVLVSGLWHGSSWNYVLWGLYHGTLMVVTRSIGKLLKLPEKWPGPLAIVQILLTVSAAFAGWLFFRETNPEFLRRWLVLSPAESTMLERQVGVHLFVLAATRGCRCSWTTSGRWDGNGAGASSIGPSRTGRGWGPPVSVARCCKRPRQESWSR
jgi:hypothetical protein